MRKLLLMAVAALVAGQLLAASDTTQVTVTVLPIEGLLAPQRVALTMAEEDPSRPLHYQPVELLQSKGLRVWHNLREPRKIIAQAETEGAGNSDITLSCGLEGGQGMAALVAGGQSRGPCNLRSQIPAGVHDLDVRWQAEASATATTPGEYKWGVVFTLTDD